MSVLRSPRLLLAGGMLLTMLVYLPGLGGEFMFDDHWNIVANEAVHVDSLSPGQVIEAATSGRAGPLKRPVAMASFGLNHYVSGLEPRGWKIANLVIHLLTGWLVFLVCRELVRALVQRDEAVSAEWVAAIVASLWLIHPLNLTAVLYVVQRMASLATLFSLWAIYLYMRGRVQLGGGGWRPIYVALGLALPLALLSKETGALIPPLLLLIEWLCFRFEARPEHRRRLFILFGITVGLPLLEFYGYQEKFDQVQAFFNEWGAWFVAAAGFTPLPYKVITIASGVTQMDLLVFGAASLISRSARFYLEALILWYFGPPVRAFVEKRLGLVALVSFALLIGGFLALKYLI